MLRWSTPAASSSVHSASRAGPGAVGVAREPDPLSARAWAAPVMSEAACRFGVRERPTPVQVKFCVQLSLISGMKEAGAGPLKRAHHENAKAFHDKCETQTTTNGIEATPNLN